jgi:L-fuconolactonase
MSTTQLPMIDAHVHLPEPGAEGATWGELAIDLGASGLERVVLVQSTPAGAARAALDHAERADAVGAAVVWVDVATPNVTDVLDALGTSAVFRGVALAVHAETDNHWLVGDDVVRGLRAVAERGLTLDLEIEPRQLPSVERLAELVPELNMVVAHLGSPFIARSEREPWGVYLLNVAPHRNVRLKLSGLVSLDTHPGHVAHQRLFVDSAVRLFGYERLMFGSDWPTHRSRSGYAEVLATTLEAAGPMTPAQRDQLFFATARDFYRIS